MTRSFPNTCAYPEVMPAVNVADIDQVEGAMGPGVRLAVWVQGCHKRCAGCINPDFLPLRYGRAVTTQELLACLDAIPNTAGVSLSGGEPILQAEALLPFVTAVRRRDLSVVCYTGYDWDELTGEGMPRSLVDFLAQVDLLIPGPYRQDLPRSGPFRESANQSLHFLGGRIRPEELEAQPAHEVILSGGATRWTGPVPQAIYRQLVDGLRTLGVNLDARARP